MQKPLFLVTFICILQLCISSFLPHRKNHVLTFGSTRFGALGNGESLLQKIPKLLDLDVSKTFSSVCAGERHSMVLSKDGELYCFGKNNNGECGNGDTKEALTPVQFAMEGDLAGKRVEKMHSRFGHTMVLVEGALYGVGENGYGQLGDDSVHPATKAVAVDTTGVLNEKVLRDVVTGNGYTIAIDTDGVMYAWGNNQRKTLGNANIASNSLVPVLVNMTLILDEVAQVYAGDTHVIAIDKGGKAYCWGYNPHGECAFGHGTIGKAANIPTPIDTSGILNDRTLVSASTGAYHSVFLDTLGRVYVAGFNFQSQLGIPEISDRTPIPTLLPMTQEIHISKVAAGDEFTLILSKNGDLFGFGNNAFAALGIGIDSEPVDYPVAIRNSILSKTRIVDIFAGKQHSLLMTDNGQVLGMGNRNYLVPSDGFQTPEPYQVLLEGSQVNDTSSQVNILASHSDRTVVLQQKSESWKVWGFGKNTFRAELGNSKAQLYQDTPLALNTTALHGRVIRIIAMGYDHSIAVDTDGNAYTWGKTRKGALCSGVDDDRISVPTLVPRTLALSGKEVVDAVAGQEFTLLRTLDGAVFACGTCLKGECGNQHGHSVQKPTPIDTSGYLKEKNLVRIAAGKSHSLVVDTDGVAYSFGSNSGLQLGLGKDDTRSVLIPTPVDASGDLNGGFVRSVAGGDEFSMFLDDHGRVYTVGTGSIYGELGQGEEKVRFATPAQVGGQLIGRNIVQITCGSHHALVLDSEGIVFGWGDNHMSQLATLSSLSAREFMPVRLSLPSRVQAVAAGLEHSVVLTAYECTDHWSGASCNITSCFGIDSDSAEVCNSQGICVDYNKCQCSDDYVGLDCARSKHFFKNYTMPAIILGSIALIVLLGCASVGIGIVVRVVMQRYRGERSDAIYMPQRLEDMSSYENQSEFLGELEDDQFPLVEERVDLIVDDDGEESINVGTTPSLHLKRRSSNTFRKNKAD